MAENEAYESNPMCEKCGGACCEAICIDTLPLALSSDFQRFLEFRTTPQIREMDGKTKLMRLFEVPCKMLIAGRCEVYSQRPMVCQVFKPGGTDCITTVISRRGVEKAKEILGEEYQIETLT